MMTKVIMITMMIEIETNKIYNMTLSFGSFRTLEFCGVKFRFNRRHELESQQHYIDRNHCLKTKLFLATAILNQYPQNINGILAIRINGVYNFLKKCYNRGLRVF